MEAVCTKSTTKSSNVCLCVGVVPEPQSQVAEAGSSSAAAGRLATALSGSLLTAAASRYVFVFKLRQFYQIINKERPESKERTCVSTFILWSWS